MKTKQVSVFAMVVMLVCIAAATSVYGQTPKPKWRPIIYKPIENGKRGLSAIPTTDFEMAAPATTRGAGCCLQFENQTGFFVDIWLDKEYRGRISPWQQEYTLCDVSGFKTFTAQTIERKQEWSGDLECAGGVVLGAK